MGWAHWGGKREIVGPDNEAEEGFEAGLAAAEEGLVVALILIVFLAWPWLKHWMRMVPGHCQGSTSVIRMRRGVLCGISRHAVFLTEIALTVRAAQTPGRENFSATWKRVWQSTAPTIGRYKRLLHDVIV